MIIPNYTIKNSKFYLSLPISFISTKYIVEITDSAQYSGSACCSYGVLKVSTNTIIVFNTENRQDYKGYVLALGF